MFDGLTHFIIICCVDFKKKNISKYNIFISKVVMLFSNGVILLLFSGLNMSVMQRHGPYSGPNIAFNKTASQYPGDYCPDNVCYSASLAVDGDDGDGLFWSRHCSHTNEQNLTNASLTINFGKSYYISGIELFNRKSGK